MAENEKQQSEECTHDCSTCSANCSSRSGGIQKEPLNSQSTVRHVIGVVSGKGGVGKSIVTSMMSVLMRRRDYGVAVLDADITGPSIPKSFGAKGDIISDGNGLIPLTTKTGIQMISVNLLLEDETRPVVWRGPVIAGTVKQFWTDVIWNDVDYMFVDMPPGTGDVPLTVFQSLPLDGIIIVTTPQELVSMIVKKAINMANLMNIPVIGLVENMSYVKCPDCGKELHVFGESRAEEVCAEYGIKLLGRVPLDPNLASLCDKGIIELMENDYLDAAAAAVSDFCE
ncbi:MAG: Mrp/NBP35 family ATP-binding protein [Ruminococcaceae bacterium]|nr:Mrp/NBP35 family ATP-binding protein [Oscillospiraceae bacterium]